MFNRYQDGFLPGPGGWFNQDYVYTMLIQEAMTAKGERDRISERVRMSKAKHKK